MNLNFGENLKKLRRSRDMTQEELADALGLSTQSVSRYETGGAYPDIEMLPVIAGYFGVTVDTLLGVSSEARKRRRDEYQMRCHAKEPDPRGQLEILKQWRSEFPDDWDAVVQTLYTLGNLPQDQREPADSALARELAKGLDRCTDPAWRGNLIYAYLYAETDEDTALRFIENYGSRQAPNRLGLLLQFYGMRDQTKMRALFQYRQMGVMSDMLNALTLFRYGGEIREAIENCNLALDFMAKLSHNPDPTKPDLWMSDKIMALLRLSNNYLFFDERKEGFDALDKAVTLIENILRLPDGAELSYGTRKFDTLNVRLQKSIDVMPWDENLCLIACAGFVVNLYLKDFPFDPSKIAGEDADGSNRRYLAMNTFRDLIAEPTWHNFSRYKDDPEYQVYAERIRKACDLWEPENIACVLTTGIVRSPFGGRLLAVATEEPAYHWWVYILFEKPECGFERAIQSFGEYVKTHKMSAARPLMAVDGDGKPVPLPKEAVSGIARLFETGESAS